MMSLRNCFNYRAIFGISQAEGLREPKCGCTFEPFVFTECRRGLLGEIQGEPELVPHIMATKALAGRVQTRTGQLNFRVGVSEPMST